MEHIRIAESDAWRSARAELLAAEIELTEQRERVAELRRSLPLGALVTDHVFQEGPADLSADGPISDVRLSELFTAPDRTLIVYQFMFGKAHAGPCPMCTMWTDGWAGVARHVAQRVDFAVVAATDVREFRAFGTGRGWRDLRLLGGGDTTFKYDFGTEDADGNQTPGLAVFRLDGEGNVRHTYSAHAQLTEDKWRGVDLLSPVWHLLDLTPEGRGDWYPSVEYAHAHA